jgi:hypothetical protein
MKIKGISRFVLLTTVTFLVTYSVSLTQALTPTVDFFELDWTGKNEIYDDSVDILSTIPLPADWSMVGPFSGKLSFTTLVGKQGSININPGEDSSVPPRQVEVFYADGSAWQYYTAFTKFDPFTTKTFDVNTDHVVDGTITYAVFFMDAGANMDAELVEITIIPVIELSLVYVGDAVLGSQGSFEIDFNDPMAYAGVGYEVKISYEYIDPSGDIATALYDTAPFSSSPISVLLSDELGDHYIVTQYEVYNGEYLFEQRDLTVTIEVGEPELPGPSVDGLVAMVGETDCWKKPVENRQATMMSKLVELQELIDTGFLQDAYDKLLHDIKPKLTALKEDEAGETFGNGVFKNAWITCQPVMDEFEVLCDDLLGLVKQEI